MFIPLLPVSSMLLHGLVVGRQVKASRDAKQGITAEFNPQETHGAVRRELSSPSAPGRSKTNAPQAIPENAGIQSKSHAAARLENKPIK